MKYFAILALAIGALASPQAASITSAPAVSTPAAVLSQSSALQCVNSCKPEDVNCKAACLGAARPNASQAIDTNKCAAKCDQGDGSPAAATAFSNCVQGCIASLFPSSQTAFGAGGSGASAASGASTTGSARASGASGSANGSGATAQQTGAADSNSARFAGAGLAGLLAIFAL